MKDFFDSENDSLPTFDFKKYTKPIKAHFFRKIILRKIRKTELRLRMNAPPTTEIAIEKPIIEDPRHDFQLKPNEPGHDLKKQCFSSSTE